MSEDNRSVNFITRIYGLSLGESCCFDNNSSWLRVPGGWVYGNMQGTCFIPYISTEDIKP